MLKKLLYTMMSLGALSGLAAAQTVTVTLSSPQNGQTVQPGATINWTISFTDSTGNNQGLALLVADLTQSATNPAFLDIPLAASVPSGMTNFARPAGITNPPTTGYRGSQRGTTGQKNLLQIGGAQNTFGTARPAGSGAGENANVVAGVGQSGAQTLASGSFTAPNTAGTYTFSLANVLANTLIQRNNPPAFSPVKAATVVLSPGSFGFTVASGTCAGYVPCDSNCDGAVDFFDIDVFILAVLDPDAYASQNPSCDLLCNNDVNNDGAVDFFDIDPFIACVLGVP